MEKEEENKDDQRIQIDVVNFQNKKTKIKENWGKFIWPSSSKIPFFTLTKNSKDKKIIILLLFLIKRKIILVFDFQIFLSSC
jgi:hypothetical protein